MTAYEMQDKILYALLGEFDYNMDEIKEIRTYADMHIAKYNEGLIIEMMNGEKFCVTIEQMGGQFHEEGKETQE